MKMSSLIMLFVALLFAIAVLITCKKDDFIAVIGTCPILAQTELTVQLSSNPVAGGLTIGDGIFPKDSLITVAATPNTGYTFTNWTDSTAIASVSPSYIFVLTKNRKLVANFTAVVPGHFAVVLSALPLQGGVVTGSGSFLSGASVTINAVENPGYTFVNWTTGTTIVSIAPNYIFNLTKDTAFVANFIPIVVVLPCPTVVNLGLADGYTIFAESGISTTGVTSVTGDMGIDPAAATAITGFGLSLVAGSAYSTSALVTGKVYAPGYAAPTPALLVTTTTNMQTAYTTANGLVVPAPVTEFMAGNLNGQTLTKGIYKWSSGVSITNGIVLDGGGDDCATFIFQIAQDLTVANSAIITLQNGAQAKNIFWVVAGSGAVLGTNVDFQGNILSKTLISVNTGGKVTGRLLAQTAVTLNAATIVKP